MRSPTHDGNKKKGVLFLGEGPIQGLDGTTLTAEMKYSIPFFVTRKKIIYACIMMKKIDISLLIVQTLLNLKFFKRLF